MSNKDEQEQHDILEITKTRIATLRDKIVSIGTEVFTDSGVKVIKK
jgi:hypothetical protein